MNQLREESESLWILTASPAIWAAHLLACYLTAAIWCAKLADRTGSLGTTRTLIVVYTVFALVGIGITAWRGFRKHSFGSATVPHDFDTPEDRHRFLGFATVLLSGLSAVGTIYVALTAVFMRSCL